MIFLFPIFALLLFFFFCTAELAALSASSPMSSSSSSRSSSPFDPHYTLYPRSYTARRIPTVPNPQIWQNLPWSEPFEDIQGSDAPTTDHPTIAQTRFKAAYNDSHLFLLAVSHPAPGLPTQAHFTQRNSPIFQKDSDMEVFIDTTGSTHQYKELEVNPINTVWNLCLDKPYRDGGQEHSGRVATDPKDPLYYEVYGQTTKTHVVSGALNDDNKGALWTVEMALSYKDLTARVGALQDDGEQPNRQPPPCPGTRWRWNWSRVEQQGAINWTWQAQRVWDPTKKRFAGVIDMHLPDAWGYLVFGNDHHANGEDDDGGTTKDPTWPAQLAAMTIYYAQHEHFERTGSFAMCLTDLMLPNEIVEPFDIAIRSEKKDSFVVVVACPCHKVEVSVREDRLLTIEHTGEESTTQTE